MKGKYMHKVWRWIEAFFSVEFNCAISIATLGLGLRFLGLSADLWEKHSWRQADVAMIARNFYRNGFHFFYPQVDYAGNLPGYVGTEFPIVPFLTSLLYLLFNEYIALGRLVSIAFFVLSIPLFYLLVRKFLGWQIAAFALFFYAVSPLCVFYTRTLMPESALLCLSIGAIFFFSLWIDKDESLYYWSACFFTATAFLVKIPIAVIGFPLAYLAFKKYGRQIFRQRKLWIFVIIVFTPSVLWYSHAFSVAASNYPFYMFGAGGWIWDGGHRAFLNPSFFAKLIVQTTAMLLTPVGLLMAIGGAIVFRKKNSGSYLFHWWTLGLLVYLVLGFNLHARHEYYQLPFVPVAATFAGVFCAYVAHMVETQHGFPWAGRRSMSVAVLLLIVLVTSLGILTTRYHTQPEELLYLAGKRVEETTSKDALIVAWDGNNPVLLYASNRRGWQFPLDGKPEDFVSYLEAYRANGAEYFVAPNRPQPTSKALSLFKSIESKVRHLVLGNDKQERQSVGGLRLFDRSSSFASYLESHYVKILDDPFAIIYNLRSVSSSLDIYTAPR
jgi:hypothetical protein